MKSPNNESFTAFVGIDWADKKHDICVQSAGSDIREFSVIPHKVEMINDWAQSLIQRFGSALNLNPHLVRKMGKRFVEGHVIVIHYEREYVAALVAAEAVEYLF